MWRGACCWIEISFHIVIGNSFSLSWFILRIFGQQLTWPTLTILDPPLFKTTVASLINTLPLPTDESTEGYPENLGITDVTSSGQDVTYVANTNTDNSVTVAGRPVGGSTQRTTLAPKGDSGGIWWPALPIVGIIVLLTGVTIVAIIVIQHRNRRCLCRNWRY